MTNHALIEAARIYGWKITERGGTIYVNADGRRVGIVSDGRIGWRDTHSNHRWITVDSALNYLNPDRLPSPSGNEIWQERRRKGLTRRYCASIVGVHGNTWGKWEFGDYIMPPEKWKLFLDATEPMLNVLPKAEKKPAQKKKNKQQRAVAMPLAQTDLRALLKSIGEGPDGYDDL
jgi:DNA-binding XRE family transcriptional regulator